MARPTDEAKTIRLDLRFAPSLIESIDEWRRNQKDIPPRAEAIRRLIVSGFDSRKWHSLVRRLAVLIACSENLSPEEREDARAIWRVFLDELAEDCPPPKDIADFESTKSVIAAIDHMICGKPVP